MAWTSARVSSEFASIGQPTSSLANLGSSECRVWAVILSLSDSELRLQHQIFSRENAMTERPRIARTHPAIIRILKASTGVAILVCLASGVSKLAIAQQVGTPASPPAPAFAPGMINHMQAMRRFKDPDTGAQPAPAVIPRFEIDRDPGGAVATFQPGGATFPVNNAFFQNLGTNGRTCFTCHQPQSGWTVGAADVAARFAASAGADPIFRLVDGATCPSADVSNSCGEAARLHTADQQGPDPDRPADACRAAFRGGFGRRSL